MTRNDTTFERQALRCLYRMSQAIARAPGLEAVCDRLLTEAVRVIPVSKASIMKYDPRDRTLCIVAAHGLPQSIRTMVRVKVGEGVSGKVFASSRPLLVKDVRHLKGVRARARYQSRSLISAPVTCVPMKVGATPIGVINMTDKRDGTPFTQRDLELLTTIANHVAAYLHLCDLAVEVDTARQTERELEIAREMQQRLLPPGRPRLPGLDVAAACITSARVGGDYYDCFSGADGAPAVVVADVAGHNVAAALTMASFRSVLRAEAATPSRTTATIVERVNRLLFDDLAQAEQFISLVYLQYLRQSRTVTFCIAGHPAPLLYCAHRKIVTPLVGGDGLLGIEPAATFVEQQVQLHRGDTLCLYTDGLTGACNTRGQAFGMPKLRHLLRSLAPRGAHATMRAILRAVRARTGSTPLADDVTVVILKVK